MDSHFNSFFWVCFHSSSIYHFDPSNLPPISSANNNNNNNNGNTNNNKQLSARKKYDKGNPNNKISEVVENELNVMEPEQIEPQELEEQLEEEQEQPQPQQQQQIPMHNSQQQLSAPMQQPQQHYQINESVQTTILDNTNDESLQSKESQDGENIKFL